MKIRRFYSHNVRTALKQVTEVFGEEAAILSNKKVAGGVEIIAALDYDESLMPDHPDEILDSEYPIQPNEAQTNSLTTNSLMTKAEPTRVNPTETAALASNQTKLEEVQVKKLSIADQIIKRSQSINSNSSNNQNIQLNNSSTLSNNLSQKLTSINLEDPKLKHPNKMQWSLDPSLQAMKEELELMREMMSEQLKGIAWNRFSEKDPLKATIIRRLSELGLDNSALASLLPTIDNQQDIECSWQNVLANLCKKLAIGGDDLLQHGGIYALVGPTGVGKTTTIAKLAARFVIKNGIDSIALISTDNQRITAQEQLATFGRILRIPCANVTEKNSLDSLLKKYADKKLILIDTAGICANQSGLIKQLDNINNSHRLIKKILLMSATSQTAVLQQSIKFFSAISPSALVITKLDEATSLGEMLSVILESNFPVVYTTDGQKIPEDIRLAKSHHLVSKAVWLANKYTRDVEEWGLAQSMEQMKSA